MPTLSFDMTRYCRFLLPAVTLFIALTAAGRAEVRMPGVFSDHAVLQRGERTPIWGTAAPGEKVSVKIAHVQGEAAADPHGIWMVRLNLQREFSSKPNSMDPLFHSNHS